MPLSHRQRPSLFAQHFADRVAERKARLRRKADALSMVGARKGTPRPRVLHVVRPPRAPFPGGQRVEAAARAAGKGLALPIAAGAPPLNVVTPPRLAFSGDGAAAIALGAGQPAPIPRWRPQYLPPVPRRAGAKPQSRKWLYVLAGVGVWLLAFFLILHFRGALGGAGRWGYLGVPLFEMLDSALVLVPTPSHAYTFAVAASLNPVLLGVLAGIGASLGELSSYALGVSGRGLVERHEMVRRLSAMPRRRIGPAIAVIAALPVVSDIGAIWAGAVRFPVRWFLFYAAIGKIIQLTIITLIGYFAAR